jgi:hypothetical protein
MVSGRNSVVAKASFGRRLNGTIEQVLNWVLGKKNSPNVLSFIFLRTLLL